VRQLEHLSQLGRLWGGRVQPALRRAAVALVACAVGWGAHWARNGTSSARLGTAALIVLTLGAVAAVAIVRRRSSVSVPGQIRRVIVPTNPELGQRSLRAWALTQRTEQDPGAGSPELAQLHFERLLARATAAAVENTANARARRVRLVAWALLGIAAVAVALGPLKIFEGLDVLVAREGRAPIRLPWLELSRISAQPPSYLRSSERSIVPGFTNEQPAGTVLNLRGVPLHADRKLVLTDGQSEVPFVSDGSGGVVARWTLRASASLRVAARFGGVLIEEPTSLDIAAAPDEVPRVVLEGAPKTVALKDLDRLELRYAAFDDHGLRQVDLVLRSGGREDRRVLSKLDGERASDRGGYALAANDAFMRRVFLPVVIRVEARDNDSLAGPKWGRSEAITVVPPAVGEPEALRYRALEKARSALVKVLAHDLDAAASTAPRGELVEQALSAIRLAVDDPHGGRPVSGGLRGFLLGQARLLAKGPAAGASTRRSEEIVLAVDAVLRQLALRDARATSKRLGDVAEEVADGARQARETEQRELGLARADAAIDAVQRGATHLAELGVLGADLGSVALADLGRIRRARGLSDLLHTELAARHLADRLRRPSPSFGGGGRGGVESGGGGGAGEQAPGDSPAADRFNQLATELEQLAGEHASEIERVEHALSQAEQSVDLSDLRDEARQRADALRDGIADLPGFASDPTSARASASLAREHAASMAQSLERVDLAEAVQAGKNARLALEESKRKLQDSFGGATLREGIDQAASALDEQLAWAGRMLERAEHAAGEQAQGSLSDSSDREGKLADRAGNLSGRGKDGEAALPQEMVENLERAEALMRDASRELGRGGGQKALEQQRQAQQLLEEAAVGDTNQEDDAGQRDAREQDGGGKRISTGGEVPREDEARRAEEFRKRVLEGLSRGRAGRLAPAVKRYAEGLLR
jgi:hypothetical protein